METAHDAMLEALRTTRENIMSLKGAVTSGMTTWDEWLAVVEDAIEGAGQTHATNPPY